jgi:hypothetical protein
VQAGAAAVKVQSTARQQYRQDAVQTTPMSVNAVDSSTSAVSRQRYSQAEVSAVQCGPASRAVQYSTVHHSTVHAAIQAGSIAAQSDSCTVQLCSSTGRQQCRLPAAVQSGGSAEYSGTTMQRYGQAVRAGRQHAKLC